MFATIHRYISAARHWIERHVVILLTIGWIAWDVSTAAAYIDGAPRQLQTAEELIHVPIWLAWVFAAALLAVGTLIPTKRGVKWRNAAASIRGLGLAINAGLLGMWGYEFLSTDVERGWVSAKNYIFMTFVALHHGWVISKHSMREG